MVEDLCLRAIPFKGKACGFNIPTPILGSIDVNSLEFSASFVLEKQTMMASERDAGGGIWS